MQYLASHYWHSANENSPSLLLQQVYHKERKLPVLLACVCSNDHNSMLGKRRITGLADWFYEALLPLVNHKGRRGIPKLGRMLEGYLNPFQNSGEQIGMSGILCVGNTLFLWKQGGAKIWLLNEKNLKPHIQELFPGKEEEGKLIFRQGRIQAGVGILLSPKFHGQPEPLNVKNAQAHSHVESYLGNLGSDASVLVVTK